MTEYEMASLHAELTSLLGITFTGFFTVLSAFLVASYLVAHKLTRTMAVIALGMFVFFCVGATMINYRTMLSLGGLTLEMLKIAQAGSGLTWHSAADISEWAPGILRGLGVALYSIATIVGIYFFFHCRRVNRKAELEAGTAQPKT
jgi:hypothetical protein